MKIENAKLKIKQVHAKPIFKIIDLHSKSPSPVGEGKKDFQGLTPSGEAMMVSVPSGFTKASKNAKLKIIVA